MVLEAARPQARSYIRIPRPGRAVGGDSIVTSSAASHVNDRQINGLHSPCVRLLREQNGQPQLTGINAYSALEVSGSVNERFVEVGHEGFIAAMRASYVLNPNRPAVNTMPPEQRAVHEQVVSDVNRRWKRISAETSDASLENRALAVYIKGLDDLSRSLTYIAPRSPERSKVVAALLKLEGEAKKGEFHPLPAGVKEACRGVLDRAGLKIHPSNKKS